MDNEVSSRPRRTTKATVIHLVHGTWPRGIGKQLPTWLQRPMAQQSTTWYDQDSNFRNALEGLLGESAEVRVFEWSGANSIGARQDATKALVEHLALARSECPEARHFVVAHSHGGNIGLDAVRIQHVSGLVTLATPFLQIRPLTISLVERWVLDQALVAILRLPLVIAIVLLFWYRSTQNHASQGLMLVFYVLVSGCFLSVFIPVFMLQVRRKLALTSIESLGLDDLGQIFPETPQETVGPAPLVSPLLMIRADGDEASKALAIARAGAEAWGMMWHLVRTMARLVSPLVLEVIQLPEAVRSVLRLIVYILGIALMLSMLVRIPSWPYLLAIAAIAWPGVIVGLAVSPFLVGTAVLYSLAFGWEMLFIVYFVNIRATDVPCSATGEMVKVSPEVRRFGQLRHSLHSFLVVPTVIASWINSLPG